MQSQFPAIIRQSLMRACTNFRQKYNPASSDLPSFGSRRFVQSFSTFSWSSPCHIRQGLLPHSTAVTYLQQQPASCAFICADNKHFSTRSSQWHKLSGRDLDLQDIAWVLNFTRPTKNLLMVDNSAFIILSRGLRTRSQRKPLNHSSGRPSSSDSSLQDKGKENGTSGPEDQQSLTLYQRFKKTYKEHGKILIAVHLVTSAIWFGSFYTLASFGLDIVPYLEDWNFSEKVIKPFKSGNLGDLAIAYLMYKLATPARYTVTLAGTNLSIRYLRKEGKMDKVAKEDTLRSLYKEGKEDIKRRSRAHLTRIRTRRKKKSAKHPSNRSDNHH